jgi:hypothetical protein
LSEIGSIPRERLMDFLCQAFFISIRIAVNEGFW